MIASSQTSPEILFSRLLFFRAVVVENASNLERFYRNGLPPALNSVILPMSTLTDLHTVPSQVPPVQTEAVPPVVNRAPYPTVLSIEQIHQLLPHRYPFSLVDRIVELIPGERAVGLKNVTFNEPHFQGHFPGQPVMPGVLIIEAMAQVGGIVLTQMPDIPAGLFMLTGVDKAKFRRPVMPGDQLVMTMELVRVRNRRFGWMKGRAEVDGQLAAEAELMFSIVDDLG